MDGKVSAIISSGKIVGDNWIKYFNTLVYRDGTNWTIKNNPTIPSDITLTIPDGDTFTVDSARTITNNGTIDNHGTLTVNGKISGGKVVNNNTLILKNKLTDTDLENHGTVTNYAVYVDGVSNVSSLQVQKNNETISPDYYILDNRLYLFTGSGSIMADVNGTKYYGTYDGSAEKALTTAFVKTERVDGVPEKAWKNVPITLPTKAIPENMTVQNKIIWTCETGNASVTENILTPTGEAGTLRIKATVKNGLGYGTDFTKTFDLQIQEGNGFDIANGDITINGNADGTVTVTQSLSDGTTNTQDVAAGEWIILTGTATNGRIIVTGGKVKLQLDNLIMKNESRSKPSLKLENKESEIVLSGKNELTEMYGTSIEISADSQIALSGSGSLLAWGNNGNPAVVCWTDGSSMTINGGDFNISAYYGPGLNMKNGSLTINGGTLHVQETTTAEIMKKHNNIKAKTVVINGGNIKLDAIQADSFTDSRNQELECAEITLYGITEDVAVTSVGGMDYGCENVKTMDKVLYVYAKDAGSITSVTAGGKKYAGNLRQDGTITYGDGKTIKKYTGTFIEGSLITISGAEAQDAVYDEQPHNGYTGTITNDKGYTGSYTFTYTGRNKTEYQSNEAPVHVGDYTVTISVFDTQQKIAGSCSFDFQILPKTLTDLSVQLSQDTYTYNGRERKPGVTLLDKNGNSMSKVDYPYNVTYSNHINAGTASVLVKSKDNGDYKFEATTSFTIEKATPTVSGVKLTNETVSNAMEPNDLTITGTTSVTGNFSIDASALTYGKKTYAWKFTPTDQTNYNTVSGTIEIDVKDGIAPTGSITIKQNVWTEFLNNITFNKFFKETTDIILAAEDEEGGSGLKSVSYYITDQDVSETAIKDVAWISYERPVHTENNKKIIVYARLEDESGNVTYLSSDGVVFDSTAPVIEGVADQSIYYVSQKVTVSDANLDQILLNQTSQASTAFTLAGNQNLTYEIRAIDKAGNELVKTVTMKTISSLTDAVTDLTVENVTSAQKDTIQGILDEINGMDLTDASDTEKSELNDVKNKMQELLNRLKKVQDEVSTEEIKQAEGITPETVTKADEERLENAAEALKKALQDYAGNYTSEEKTSLEDKIEQMEDCLNALTQVEKAEEEIKKLPNADNCSTDDESAVTSLKKAEELYDALTEHEKSLVDADLVTQMQNLKEKLSSYAFLEGDGQTYIKGKKEGLKFTVNGAFSKFLGIRVDGQEVSQESYTAESGSTILQLSTEYLNTLEKGEHTLTVVYSDGEKDGTFIVKGKSRKHHSDTLVNSEQPANPENLDEAVASPNTGDTSHILLWSAVGLISAALLLGAAIFRKRKVK